MGPACGKSPACAQDEGQEEDEARRPPQVLGGEDGDEGQEGLDRLGQGPVEEGPHGHGEKPRSQGEERSLHDEGGLDEPPGGAHEEHDAQCLPPAIHREADGAHDAEEGVEEEKPHEDQHGHAATLEELDEPFRDLSPVLHPLHPGEAGEALRHPPHRLGFPKPQAQGVGQGVFHQILGLRQVGVVQDQLGQGLLLGLEPGGGHLGPLLDLGEKAFHVRLGAEEGGHLQLPLHGLDHPLQVPEEEPQEVEQGEGDQGGEEGGEACRGVAENLL